MHEELIKRVDEIEAFLNGSGQLDGLSFGDNTMGQLPKYWWRASVRELFELVRTALTAPQAETKNPCPACEGTGIERELTPEDEAMIDAAWERHKAAAPTWIRKDGSTTPRGDVVDRRKTMNGDPSIMRRANMHLGRRKDDLARWAAPVQETPQTLEAAFTHVFISRHESLDQYPTDKAVQFGMLRWLLRELDRRSAGK